MRTPSVKGDAGNDDDCGTTHSLEIEARVRLATVHDARPFVVESLHSGDFIPMVENGIVDSGGQIHLCIRYHCRSLLRQKEKDREYYEQTRNWVTCFK